MSSTQPTMSTYRTMGSGHITADVATVDCHKQVRSWRLLRALVELLIPTCNCSFIQEESEQNSQKPRNFFPNSNPNPNPNQTNSSIITGTIFGNRRGKVKFCIQTNSNSRNPILLLELAVPTMILAREMQGGVLRIALECSNCEEESSSSLLLEMPVWKMYCNGRRVGFAIRRQPSKADMEVLRRSVAVGAGVIHGREIGFGCSKEEEDDDVMYLRGNFERVSGSSDAESFHLIDHPDGNIKQDLSIFFLRSR